MSDRDDDLTDDTLELDDNDADTGTPNPGGEDRGDLVASDDTPDPKAARRPAAEAADDTDDADDAATGRKPMPSMIPKARFDEVNDTAKELRRQNELLMQALAGRGEPGAAPAPAAAAAPAAPAVVDLDALEGEYITALLDGDTDRAKELRRTIRTEESRVAVEQAMAVQANQTAQQSFAAEVQAIYVDYPELNNKGPKADAAAIAEVVEWRDFLVDRKGMSYHTALRQAADRVATARGWGKAEGDEPAARDPRIEAQRRRNAQANLDQPPALEGGVGERAGRARQTNVAAMSDQEFHSLPDAEKKRLRGD